VLDRLASLGEPDAYAGTPLSAPVLIVPRIFDLELCERLTALHGETGGQLTGVTRVEDGRSVVVLNDMKRRRDVTIHDPALISAVTASLARRLLPEVRRAFQFDATHIERHMVACYDAADGGYFLPHRDDGAPATAHRRFAVSINLNADGFEGGDLRFPEYGGRTYRPPTGGAVVFSCSLLHEVLPVTQGRRYACLPFLYDEAAARLRCANAQENASPRGREEAD
jgi:predicted 2-oxoglutarate/Fe(II)-dependent dioxygenase YbiX